MNETDVNRLKARIQMLESDNKILKKRLKERDDDLKVLNKLYQNLKEEKQEILNNIKQERFKF